MQITEIRRVTPELLAAINGLLPQLSGQTHPLNASELAAVLKADGSHLFMASEDEKYYGMLTLICLSVPTGLRARIEDLVVDVHARGRGVGRSLTTHAVQCARDWGCRVLELTSNPARLAANRLYQQMGFEIQITNVYRLNLQQ